MAWTTTSDFAVGHVVTAAEWNASLGVSGNTQYLKGRLDGLSQTTTANAFDTVYQNTSGKSRHVVVSAGMKLAELESLDAYVENATPPTIRVSRLSCYIAILPSANYIIGNLVFMVPPSWYYKVTQASNTMNMLTWSEWDL